MSWNLIKKWNTRPKDQMNYHAASNNRASSQETKDQALDQQLEDRNSEEYWSGHNVTNHLSFRSAMESLRYLDWRNDQYIGYIDLLPVCGHDGEAVLDFGCGPGNDLVGFLKYSKPAPACWG